MLEKPKLCLFAPSCYPLSKPTKPLLAAGGVWAALTARELAKRLPSTFLEAAKCGLPTVSLQVDPGAMLSQHGCGQQCDGDLDRLKETVRLFMKDARL